MKLLQVCNVGRIVGGTAACARSLVHALPTWQHRVAVLGTIDEATRAAFAPVTMRSVERITPAVTRGADVVLLHNTPAARVEPLPYPTRLLRHSPGQHARADAAACVSFALRDRLPWAAAEPVLWQGVPPPQVRRDATCDEVDRPRLIGRLCTPTSRKWPADCVSLYERLAAEHPTVQWEFVGAPPRLHSALAQACGGRAAFVSAGLAARDRLATWDALLYSNRRLPETFGRTVAEAMRAGCLPIVDDLGGFREQLTPGTGWLCRSPADFVHAIALLHDRTERVQRRRACRERGDAVFSEAAMAGRFELWLRTGRVDALHDARVAERAADGTGPAAAGDAVTSGLAGERVGARPSTLAG